MKVSELPTAFENSFIPTLQAILSHHMAPGDTLVETLKLLAERGEPVEEPGFLRGFHIGFSAAPALRDAGEDAEDGEFGSEDPKVWAARIADEIIADLNSTDLKSGRFTVERIEELN